MLKNQNKEKHEDEKMPRKRLLVLIFRWFVFLYLIQVIFNELIEENLNGSTFIFFIIILFYNLIVTYYAIKTSTKEKVNSKLIIFFDIMLTSAFACQWGGMYTDVFILYFFIIAYCSICKNPGFTIKISILSLVSYTIASIYAGNNNIAYEVNFLVLITRDFFILIAGIAVILISSEAKKYDELHRKDFKMARTDKLTGLANRHYFEQKLAEEVEYSNLTGNPLNILIFDLDNFKKFNDTYGHVWGDKLLTLFSDIIKQCIRKSDIPVRYGGEEFLIMVRDLDFHTAKSVGERIRTQLERQRIYVGLDDDRKRATVSCGVAQYPKDSKNIKEVIEFADKALYHAKENGKNRISCYGETLILP